MIDDTVLVVDADHEIEDKIVSVLEGEGYLVFTASGRDINAEMADKITPSLIYLKPTSGTIEGFEVCKTIHNIEKFRNVPIILLASLKGPLDPRYTSVYGISDYLKLPLNEEELINKTREMYEGASHEFHKTGEDMVAVKGVGLQTGSADLKKDVLMPEAEEHVGVVPDEDFKPGSAKEDIPQAGHNPWEEEGADEEVEIGRPSEEYSYSDVQEKLKETLGSKGPRSRPRKFDLLVPLGIVLASIAVVAGGFFAYRFFISSPEKKAAVAMKSSQPIQTPAALPPVPEPIKKEQPAPVETKPAETKAAGTKAAGTKVAETKPAETKPAETKQSETKPVTTRPAETKPVETSKTETKQAPKKATAPMPESRPAGKPGYSVQLGAFKGEGAAEVLVKTLKGKGYEAFSSKGTARNGTTVYRVLVGRFENKKEALQLAGRIKTKEKLSTTLFRE